MLYSKMNQFVTFLFYTPANICIFILKGLNDRCVAVVRLNPNSEEIIIFNLTSYENCSSPLTCRWYPTGIFPAHSGLSCTGELTTGLVWPDQF